MNLFKMIKIVAVITGLLGLLAIIEPADWFLLPVMVGIGILIFCMACLFERLILEIRDKNKEDK